MLGAGTGSAGVYDALVGAHVVAALVGFGSLGVTGVYGFSGRRAVDDTSLEETRRYFRAPGRLELALLAVPFLGAAALLVEPHGGGAGQLWAVVAGLIWLLAAVVLLGVVRPAEARMRAVLALDPGASTDRPTSDRPTTHRPTVAAIGGRLGWASLVTDLSFFAALLLMIFQPG